MKHSQKRLGHGFQILFSEIGIYEGNHCTIISDEMQGITSVVKFMGPNLEHRLCTRHIFINFKKHNKRERLVDNYYGAIRVTIESEFQYWMNELKNKDEGKILC